MAIERCEHLWCDECHAKFDCGNGWAIGRELHLRGFQFCRHGDQQCGQQAEHDVDAAAIFFTPVRKLANAVAAEVERQLTDLSTNKVARKSIDKNSAIIITSSLEQAVELSNQFAPEHLSIPELRLLDAVTFTHRVDDAPTLIDPFFTRART